ncbi:MAG: response regulator, partial [Actinobacteria bacterium]|nr:response regulator [Actinomycetota bacterium]
LVVEDEPLMSSLLADVLFEHGFTVRTAVDVAQARREINAFDPDVLLLDVSLGEGPTGIHLAHAMRLSRPDIAILVFTGHSDIASVNTDGLALPPGVGLLRKHLVSDKAYLIEALEKVLREEGNLVKKEEEAEDVFAFLGFNGSRALRMLAAGYDNEEIALRCTVSRKTVERWIEQIYRDLGIDTKGSLNPRVAAARRFFFAIGVPGTEK